MSSKLFQLPLLPGHLHAVKPGTRRKSPPNMTLRGGKRSPLWYALYLPQLTAQAGDPETALLLPQRLYRLAELLSTLSATVSIEEPDSFLFEVRSSLNYFGGIEKIRSRLQSLLETQLQAWGLPTGFHQAASPTPAASLLLARAGCNTLIHRTENLRSALGRLSVQVMPLKADRRRQLHNTGLRKLRDIWRLPTHGLGQRFGLDFVRQLERCLGQVPSPLKTWQSAPVFNTSKEFDYPVEATVMLLHSVEEMLGKLSHFLRQRELAATHLQLTLQHERQESTVLSLDLRQPTRQEAHLFLLLETRINSLLLPAPVTAMHLEVQHFAPFVASSEALQGMTSTHTGHTENIIPLLEQLQARLGNAAVRSIFCVEDHCPEHAGQDRMFSAGMASASVPLRSFQTPSLQTPSPVRPCWLLPEPLPLTQSDGRLYYRSSLSLLSGPERIETHWWTGQDVRRDYYVACNRQGMRLWIFHDRRGERQWFLHGIFD